MGSFHDKPHAHCVAALEGVLLDRVNVRESGKEPTHDVGIRANAFDVPNESAMPLQVIGEVPLGDSYVVLVEEMADETAHDLCVRDGSAHSCSSDHASQRTGRKLRERGLVGAEEDRSPSRAHGGAWRGGA